MSERPQSGRSGILNRDRSIEGESPRVGRGVALTAYQLAQVNVARPVAPIGSATMQEFVDNLGPVNAVADTSPGFVWRLQTEHGNATSLHVFGDAHMLINMSVWESVDALREFVQRSVAHRAVLRRRKEWFEPMAEAYMALWWIPSGHVPTIAEAEQRLTHLRMHGPTPLAFTFRATYPPPLHEPGLFARKTSVQRQRQ
ncbi:MAG: DUF3291 domain-containing protein [Candidatus Dormibacteraeota bacterium]|nr:DUF3291 domain-containing protein [Candidatus Dormibacteraeota bacterium]